MTPNRAFQDIAEISVIVSMASQFKTGRIMIFDDAKSGTWRMATTVPDVSRQGHSSWWSAWTIGTAAIPFETAATVLRIKLTPCVIDASL